MRDLTGKKALVCGGSEGIGLASAQALAALGVDVRGTIHAGPHRLAEALQIENRQRLVAAKHLVEDVRDLLAQGTVLVPRALLQTPVELVRKTLDVQGCH